MLTENFRMLAIDTSTSPGFAVIEVRARGKHKGQPRIIHLDSLKTSSSDTDDLRFAVITAKTTQICYDHGPFDVVVREHFAKGGSKRGTQLVFGAWAAVDVALGRFGYHIDASNELTPSTVKKLVGGRGGADKPEVEAGVRKLFDLEENYIIKNDDESDAAAIGYTWLYQKGMIDEWHLKQSKS